MQVLLQKYLRDVTGISRRNTGLLIKEGKVTVNGELAYLGQLVTPDQDKIELHRKEIVAKPEAKKLYVLFNKPAGCVTSKFDPHNPKTIYRYLPKKYEILFPVGRLDKESEGLLILTNDGDFAYEMTHPKFEVAKEYYVELDGMLKDSQISKIENGFEGDEITYAPAKITQNKGRSLHITLHEGQKREIRRLFKEFGITVTYLRRLTFGGFELGDIPLGKYTELSEG